MLARQHASSTPRTSAAHILLPHPGLSAGRPQDSCTSCRFERPHRPDQLQAHLPRWPAISTRCASPSRAPPVRTDGLWRHTCFEAFIGQAGGRDYWEYNFSPSGAWAAYHFSGYREGMAPLLKGARARRSRVDATARVVRAVGGTSICPGWRARRASGLRLGVAAVIEDRARVLSYWALKHPAGETRFPPRRRLRGRARLTALALLQGVLRDPVRHRPPVRRQSSCCASWKAGASRCSRIPPR